MRKRRELSRNLRRGNIPSRGNNTGDKSEFGLLDEEQKQPEKMSEVGDEERDKIV